MLRRKCGSKSEEITGEWRRGALWFVLLTECCLGYQIKQNEIGVARSTYEGEEKCIPGLGEKT